MKNFISFILLLFAVFSYAQNPPSVHWKQLSGKHFNVIYPQDIENTAKQTYFLLEKAFVLDTQTYHVAPRKIDIFLFEHNTNANAYARLAPRQMVWYTTPSLTTNISITPWLELLAIHEYRHVVQMRAFNRYITAVASILFGQYGQAIFETISVPSWFLEGDAVYNETIYSNSGRGRISQFDLPVRTMLLSNKPPKFEHFLFRSYKNYYPNHYYLGYFMVSYVNRNYGQQVWDKVARRTSKFSFYPFAFSNSLKRFTGYNTKKTFYNTMCELDSLWRLKYKDLDTTQCTVINKKHKRTWTNYTSPFQFSNDTIIALKSGLDNRQTVIFLTQNKELKIKEIAGQSISYAKNFVVWSQKQPHIRWSEVNYSQIAIMNLKNKKIKQITKKGKFLFPYLSADAEKIVAVKNFKMKTNIVIFNTKGKLLNTIPNLKNDIISYPRPNYDASKIVYTHSNKYGQALSVVDTKTLKITKLIDYQWSRIMKPLFYKNYIFFNWDPDGIANIYAIDTISKQIYKLTSRPFGVGDFQVINLNNNDYLIFSDYTVNGYNIASMPININNWSKIDTVKDTRLLYFKSINTPPVYKLFDVQVDTSYTITKYNQLKHLINIHSWALMPDLTSLNPYKASLLLFSDNKLHTLSLTTSFTSFLYVPTLLTFVNFSYSKYFPVFNGGISFGTDGIMHNSKVYTWKTKAANLSINIPLNFSRGLIYRTINFSLGSNFKNISGLDDTISLNISPGNRWYLWSDAIIINRKFADYRDITSRLGQSFHFNFYHIISPTEQNINRIKLDFSIFLPGILPHHSIQFASNTVLFNKLNNDYLSWINLLPDGYTPNFTHYKSAYKISLKYYMPLCYPDFGINPIFYIKRIRTTLFYETSVFYPSAEKFSSIGMEFIFDGHLFRYNLFEGNIGIQFAYLITDKNYSIVPQLMGINIPF